MNITWAEILVALLFILTFGIIAGFVDCLLEQRKIEKQQKKRERFQSLK